MFEFAMLIVLINVAYLVLRIYLSVKHPATFKAFEEIEEKRRERNRNNLVRTAKFGIGVYKALRR